MPRYIDAEIFDKNLMMEVYLADDEDFTKAFVRGMELVKKAEEETPTADVQEVKHGRWKETVPTTPKSYRRICSVCCGVAYMIGKKYSYCPYCGAKMDLEEKENG